MDVVRSLARAVGTNQVGLHMPFLGTQGLEGNLADQLADQTSDLVEEDSSTERAEAAGTEGVELDVVEKERLAQFVAVDNSADESHSVCALKA